MPQAEKDAVARPRIQPIGTLVRTVIALLLFTFQPVVFMGQRGGPPGPRSIEVNPSRLTLDVGESATLEATVRDADGNVLAVPVLFLNLDERALTVGTESGRVEAHRPGTFGVVARVPGGRGGRLLSVDVEVVVPLPPLDRVEVVGLHPPVYAGTFLQPDYHVYDVRDTPRDDLVLFSSTDPAVLEVDRFGQLSGRVPGTATLRLEVGDVTEDLDVEVLENPIRSLELTASESRVRTGDVIRFSSVARDALGRSVEQAPVYYSVESHPNQSDPASPASAQVTQDGRFVAERPGLYTVSANVGTAFQTVTIDVVPREVEREITVVGRGPVRDTHSADIWIWEGLDGRDYAITGTWGGRGEAHIWDVTDPAAIVRIDEVRVDARTINDVKVSRDGSLAVVTREGASNRRNGVIILDVSNPRDVREIAAFDEGLTGGVHNVFIDQDYLYAVNNGTRYDVISIAEPSNPFRVATVELDTPGHSVHDVWVNDGIAYSSNWEDGVVLVDVGNGIAGGAPDHPVEFASYRDPGGHTHAAFPFHSQSTGRFYVIVGDESFPNGLDPQGPTVPAGYIHIVDFSDLTNPAEVARFEVPEAGSHNMWVEGDVLYAAFYNGGLRVVDLSGELMGDLYRQGREIARFLPKDARGIVPNESMVWGAQPYKGVIYLSDWNSGLWALELGSQEQDD